MQFLRGSEAKRSETYKRSALVCAILISSIMISACPPPTPNLSNDSETRTIGASGPSDEGSVARFKEKAPSQPAQPQNQKKADVKSHLTNVSLSIRSRCAIFSCTQDKDADKFPPPAARRPRRIPDLEDDDVPAPSTPVRPAPQPACVPQLLQIATLRDIRRECSN